MVMVSHKVSYLFAINRIEMKKETKFKDWLKFSWMLTFMPVLAIVPYTFWLGHFLLKLELN